MFGSCWHHGEVNKHNIKNTTAEWVEWGEQRTGNRTLGKPVSQGWSQEVDPKNSWKHCTDGGTTGVWYIWRQKDTTSVQQYQIK